MWSSARKTAPEANGRGGTHSTHSRRRLLGHDAGCESPSLAEHALAERVLAPLGAHRTPRAEHIDSLLDAPRGSYWTPRADPSTRFAVITPRGIRRDHRPVASKSAASAQQAPQQRARCKHSQCVAWTWHGSRTAACDDRTATVSSRKHLGTHKGWSQDTLSARLLVSIHRQSKVQRKHEAA